MNDFIAVLTHGRKLQGAVKELSIDELEQVAEKLARIIENRKEKEAAAFEAEKARLAKIEEITRQLAEAGLSADDLKSVAAPKVRKNSGQKRPVKYKLTDANGEHTWTGIGRMPRVFADALHAGKTLEQFKI